MSMDNLESPDVFHIAMEKFIAHYRQEYPKQMDAFQKTDYAMGAHSKWFTGMFPSSPPDSLSHTDSFSSWHSILLYPYYNRVILCFCDSKPRGVLSINGPHAHDMDRHV